MASGSLQQCPLLPPNAMRAALLVAIVVGSLAAYSSAAAAQEESTPVFGTTVVIPSGLRGLVYHIHHRATELPNFEKMKPAGPPIYTSSLNVPAQDFRQGFPGVTKRTEWFAIDYTGKFWIDEPGAYKFNLLSDDGAKLYIDDQVVIDNDGIHAPRWMAGSVELAGGLHRIRVSYFQGPKWAIALVLKVAGPGQKLRVFSTDEFKPPPDPGQWRFPKGSESPPNQSHALEK
jgi:PA14 domain